MDLNEVTQALALDQTWVAELRQCWLRLMEVCLFGDLKSSRLGAMPRLRKRLLDVGEKLRSLMGDREWIPRPREQVKNALGSSFNLKDSLLQLEKCAQDVNGGTDRAVFNSAMARFHTLLLPRLEGLENRWAALLDSQYRDQVEEGK